MKRKILTMVIAVLMVFAFTTTAFAIEWVDTASWSSTVCLHGFTTKDSVQRASWCTEWYNVTPWLTRLEFAHSPEYDFLLITPKTSSGLTMGNRGKFFINTVLKHIEITSYKDSLDIHLRIDNPNTNNNMKSAGDWDGAIS